MREWKKVDSPMPLVGWIKREIKVEEEEEEEVEEVVEKKRLIHKVRE